MKKITLILIGIALLSATVRLRAAGLDSVKVIVHPSNSISSMGKDQLARIFMKKLTEWEGGSRILVVDLTGESAVRNAFCREVFGKSLTAVKSYWQQQIFSGRGVPPLEKASDAEVLAYVKANQGAIGYVSADAPTGGVKVIAIQP